MKLRVGIYILIIGLVLMIIGFAVKETGTPVYMGCLFKVGQSNPCNFPENLQQKIGDIIFYIGSAVSLCGIGLSVISLIQKFKSKQKIL